MCMKGVQSYLVLFQLILCLQRFFFSFFLFHRPTPSAPFRRHADGVPAGEALAQTLQLGAVPGKHAAINEDKVCRDDTERDQYLLL